MVIRVESSTSTEDVVVFVLYVAEAWCGEVFSFENEISAFEYTDRHMRSTKRRAFNLKDFEGFLWLHVLNMLPPRVWR
jgi:hypothetical protein